MNISGSVRFAVGYGLAAVLISGCGGLQAPFGAQGALPQSRAISPARVMTREIGRASSSYRILHNFGAFNNDGRSPQLGHLIAVNGTFYGTTEVGGKYGRGTVFSINASGTEHVLHSFGAVNDGFYPYAGLINVNGTLYGTTYLGGTGGGTNGYGTVFSVSTTGVEHVLYSFATVSYDGVQPLAGLINLKGTLYGTTKYGGTLGFGTVFSISTSGKEHVVYSFGGYINNDGANPEGGLINVNGTLYGTTGEGDTQNYGTVFSVSTSGTEQVLHRFAGGLDGNFPEASLVDLNGALYGTTVDGGEYSQGLVFSINLAGSERPLYNFGTISNDGAQPYSSLIAVNGALDGTTQQGGVYGKGTVFSVSPSGQNLGQVLYNFGSLSNDGSSPTAGLLNVKGTLYGMTTSGGKYGYGTVFALTP